jgi:ornithine cyclodeaminase/alanine dehydrogenase-like protein (mu-crystallin family)
LVQGTIRDVRGASMRVIEREEIARRLTYEACIPLVRAAMVSFSAGETRQLLRAIIPLAHGHLFGVMPGALGEDAAFGAKLISVYPENFSKGRQSHQGLVALFEPTTGEAVCVLHAGEITAIRTAAASAAATAALARPESRRLAILGYGEQAATHARAMVRVRGIEAVGVWGRSPQRAAAFCERMQAELTLPFTCAPDAEALVGDADIVCTVTASREPVLKGAWVRPGTHVNVVGSGVAGPVEIDTDLVVRSRFIVDSREGVLKQGAEFLRAKAEGAVGDAHIAAEIGEVFAGIAPGRQSASQITVYKSLGHVVQDLACAWALYSGSGLP